MNINIILPYKETYSENLAGAVSLLVAEVKNQSKFKNNIKIFGSLNIDKPLTKDCDNLLVSDCSIEIHLDKDRIIDIMLVA